MYNIKKIITATAIFIAIATLSACNTVEGIGKDIKSAGSTVENTAKEIKN